jgi:hypothetical protein
MSIANLKTLIASHKASAEGNEVCWSPRTADRGGNDESKFISSSTLNCLSFQRCRHYLVVYKSLALASAR